jgi:hypothetical protein
MLARGCKRKRLIGSDSSIQSGEKWYQEGRGFAARSVTYLTLTEF